MDAVNQTNIRIIKTDVRRIPYSFIILTFFFTAFHEYNRDLLFRAGGSRRSTKFNRLHSRFTYIDFKPVGELLQSDTNIKFSIYRFKIFADLPLKDRTCSFFCQSITCTQVYLFIPFFYIGLSLFTYPKLFQIITKVVSIYHIQNNPNSSRFIPGSDDFGLTQFQQISVTYVLTQFQQ